MRRSLLRRYRLFSPQLLRSGLLLLALLLLCDGIAQFWLPQLQAALALTTPTSSVAASVDTSMNATALVSDNFTRADQRYWGASPEGTAWQADASMASSFSIAGNKGVIGPTPGNLCGVLGPVVSDSEVLFTASLSHYGPSSLGAVLRWTSPADYYAAELDGQKLTIERMMDGMETPLNSIPFYPQDNVSYTFLFRAAGTHLSAAAWPTGQPAPADWQISLPDNAFTSGQAGIVAAIQPGVQAQVSNFKEVEL
jgi:hypothetical protein